MVTYVRRYTVGTVHYLQLRNGNGSWDFLIEKFSGRLIAFFDSKQADEELEQAARQFNATRVQPFITN